MATTEAPRRRLLTICIFFFFFLLCPLFPSASIGCLQQRGTRRSGGASFIKPGVERVRPCTGCGLYSFRGVGGDVKSPVTVIISTGVSCPPPSPPTLHATLDGRVGSKAPVKERPDRNRVGSSASGGKVLTKAPSGLRGDADVDGDPL